MKQNVKRITLALLTAVFGVTMLAGCERTEKKKTSGIVQLPSSSSVESTSSAVSTKVTDTSQTSNINIEDINIEEGIIPIRSLSQALENFSEIENRTAEGTPEEIVQTLLERNILCFAVLQGKCWSYDERKYSDNYYFSNGIIPIKSQYISSTQQIDDLFYSTYTISETDFLIHYYDGDSVTDAFTYIDGLYADFSQILKNAMDSFETPSYAAVKKVYADEIVFERYSEPNTDEGAPQPNNFQFSAVQRSNGEWVLRDYIIDVPAYSPMYDRLIETNRKGNPDIEKIAMTEVGNFGGLPYCHWYGFSYRIEWCAAFVSWCYGQAGLDQPFFAAVNSEGIPWFKDHGQWADADYRDIAPGDCIFMDWENDGKANHVGLVIGTDGEKVYTIEGNRSDACQAFAYDLDDPRIFGYGLMEWD